MGEGEINEHNLIGKNSKLLEHTNTLPLIVYSMI